MQEKGIILLGHGSRDPLWRQPMEAVAARLVVIQPGLPVRCAFLELEPPTLAEAANELAAAGVANVSITPMFLGSGKHVREDLPLLLQALATQHPAVKFKLQPPVGDDSRVLDLLARVALG
ncbi:MAG: sirohydrochlorin chelatase [Ramlibacter sp.]